MPNSGFSLRDLGDLCVSAVNNRSEYIHRRDAENAKGGAENFKPGYCSANSDHEDPLSSHQLPPAPPPPKSPPPPKPPKPPPPESPPLPKPPPPQPLDPDPRPLFSSELTKSQVSQPPPPPPRPPRPRIMASTRITTTMPANSTKISAPAEVFFAPGWCSVTRLVPAGKIVSVLK